jgi:hypothetical protein
MLVLIITLIIVGIIFLLLKPTFDVVEIQGFNYLIMWYNVLSITNIKTRKYIILWKL